ncbi:hypothetical protein AB4166_08680 [Vibrio splendidus]|nr:MULTISPECIES: hypothetical protein [Vibrio]MCT4346944.1 hypothetical protein [Vibrio sp. NC2]SBS61063.1 hypothetical protein VHE8714_00513 [Vibrio splendidus]
MKHTTNRIGIEKNAAETILAQLIDFLSEYSVFANNARAQHWNVRGP